MKVIDKIMLGFLVLAIVFGAGFYSGYDYGWRENAWLQAGEFYIAEGDLHGWAPYDVGTAVSLEKILWKEMRKLEKGKNLPYVNWEVYFAIHKKTKRPTFLVVKRKTPNWSPEVIYSSDIHDLDVVNGKEMGIISISVQSSDPEVIYQEFVRSRLAPMVYQKLYEKE